MGIDDEGEEKKVYTCDASKKIKYTAIKKGSKSVYLTCRKKKENKGFLYEKTGKLVKKKKNVLIVKNVQEIVKVNQNEIVFVSNDDTSKEISDSLPCNHKKCMLNSGTLVDPELSLLQFTRIQNFL